MELRLVLAVHQGIEHYITNASSQPHRQIIVELRCTSSSPTPPPPETSGRFP